MEIGDEGEVVSGAGAEGGGGGSQGTDGSDVKLGHNGCQQSLRKAIQSRLHTRHFSIVWVVL